MATFCHGQLQRLRTLLFMSMLMVLNIMIGAVIFSLIEKGKETEICINQKKSSIEYVIKNIFNDEAGFTALNPDGNGLPNADLLAAYAGSATLNFAAVKSYLNHMKTVVEICEVGSIEDLSVSLDDCPDHWSVRGASFFMSTVSTTVGYGGSAPKKDMGKLFFIVYCFPSILIGVLFIGALGQFIKYAFDAMGKKIEKKVAGDEFDEDAQGCGKAKACGIMLKILAYLFFFFLIPSIIYYAIKIDEWSFIDAFYFHAVSSTTVGFGDFILDYENANTGYNFINTIFLYLGLAVWTSHLEEAQELYKKIKDYVHTRLCTKLECEETGGACSPRDDEEGDEE